jgi:hypothetical protein
MSDLITALERTRKFEKECKAAWEKDVDNPHKREYDVLGMSDALMEQILIQEEVKMAGNLFFIYRWSVLGMNSKGKLTVLVNRETREEVIVAATEFVQKYNTHFPKFETFFLADRSDPRLIVGTGALTIPQPPPPSIMWNPNIEL